MGWWGRRGRSPDARGAPLPPGNPNRRTRATSRSPTGRPPLPPLRPARGSPIVHAPPLPVGGGDWLTQAAVPELSTLGVMHTCITRTFHHDRVFCYFLPRIFLNSDSSRFPRSPVVAVRPPPLRPPGFPPPPDGDGDQLRIVVIRSDPPYTSRVCHRLRCVSPDPDPLRIVVPVLPVPSASGASQTAWADDSVVHPVSLVSGFLGIHLTAGHS